MNGTNELSAALAAVTADAVDELLAGYVGRNVLIRTVTMYHLGRVEAVTAKFVRLEAASWVADAGRWSTALAQGVSELREVEPFVAGVLVAVDAIVDLTEWSHELPKAAK